MALLTMYAIRNKEGKWYHRKGYCGYGDSWVDDIKQARIFGTLRPARGQVSYWALNYPDFGIPDIIQLDVDNLKVLDETERINKVKEKKQREEENAEVWRTKHEFEQAKANYEKAQKELDRLQNEKMHKIIQEKNRGFND